jgi:hypothetical protein
MEDWIGKIVHGPMLAKIRGIGVASCAGDWFIHRKSFLRNLKPKEVKKS